MDRDRTDPYGFGRRDECPRGDGGDGGRDLKRPRHGYDPSGRAPPPPRHYAPPAPGYAPGYQGGFFGGPRGGPPPGYIDAFWNDSIRPSQSQLGVSHALNVLGWDHEDELRTEDGLSLDMAQPSTKTAVEFDGPTHYLQGPDGPSVDGRTAFKRRLLGRLGWTCAAVPYFEWDPLLASGATEPYLRGVLARLRSE